MSSTKKSKSIYAIRANGKLMLTGEYFVLDGALSMAFPTKFGQSLEVFEGNEKGLIWQSLDVAGKVWFEGNFSLPDLEIKSSSDRKTGEMLQKILRCAKEANSDFLSSSDSLRAITKLEFPRDWGLGSSSTLLFCIAKWAGINAFDLSDKTLGGSGYDIACAGAEGPIFYEIKDLKVILEGYSLNSRIVSKLWFVHLGKKQNSREGIKRYREQNKEKAAVIDEITEITIRINETDDLKVFESLLKQHEKLVATFLELTPAKALYFNDFWGEIKSLGAWGGDFVLATSERGRGETVNYFEGKGFRTVLSWKEMILEDEF